MRWLWTIPLLCSVAFGQSASPVNKFGEAVQSWRRSDANAVAATAMANPGDTATRSSLAQQRAQVRATFDQNCKALASAIDASTLKLSVADTATLKTISAAGCGGYSSAELLRLYRHMLGVGP